MLFAALLLADELKEVRAGAGIARAGAAAARSRRSPKRWSGSPARMEALADSLERERAERLDRDVTGTARYELYEHP